MRKLAFTLVSFGLIGCIPHPDKPSGGDAGPTPDSGTVVDSGPEPDAAQPDAGEVPDGSTPVVDGQVPTDGAAGPDAQVLTTTGMLASACVGTTCSPAKVVAYWRSAWDNYSIKRTIRFTDSAAAHAFVVTDETGAPATLSFEAGIPVSLTLVNPGDTSSTGKHDLTAPELYRSVAWRRVKTLKGEFRATHFDALHVRRRSGSDLSMVLEFVPMNPGTFDAYCQVGVPNGTQYEAIIAGTVDPDLASAAGHAGKGGKTQVTVASSLGVTISYPTPPLAADPRRLDTHAVWASGARNETYRGNPLKILEFSDEEYGFVPANLSLSASVGTVIRIENPLANLRAHVLAAPTFLGDSVIREVQDADTEAESSTLTSVQMLIGGWAELFIVPTRAATYGSYCDIGVSYNTDGSPKLTTGHAGRGMIGSMVVSP